MPELTSSHIVESIDQELVERVSSLHEAPKLAILSDNTEHLPSLKYVGIKQRIAAKLGISATALFMNNSQELHEALSVQNTNSSVDGIIVQLPLADRVAEEPIVSSILPSKDVDGLGGSPDYAPATPLGILTLIEGYGINYQDSRVALLGRGRLVGAPLYRLMQERGAKHISAFDADSKQHEIQEGLNKADLIISAVGKPGLLSSLIFDSVESKTFIDAGAAESGGVVVGDISDELRAIALQNDCYITPTKGGVGPLTVRALLNNVVTAAEQRVS